MIFVKDCAIESFFKALIVSLCKEKHRFSGALRRFQETLKGKYLRLCEVLSINSFTREKICEASKDFHVNNFMHASNAYLLMFHE